MAAFGVSGGRNRMMRKRMGAASCVAVGGAGSSYARSSWFRATSHARRTMTLASTVGRDLQGRAAAPRFAGVAEGMRSSRL